PTARGLEIESSDTIAEIVEKLRGLAIDHVIWIAPRISSADSTDESMIDDHQDGVLLLFRTVKALLSLGYGSKDLGWSIVTTQSQCIHKHDTIYPVHASIHGLVGSMAKEYGHWKVRLADVQHGVSLPLETILTLPVDAQGNAL